MECTKCEERMEVDVDNQRYICRCGCIINWSGDREDAI